VVSKQRRWQKKQIAAGRCQVCGKEKQNGIMCRACKDKHNQRRRMKNQQQAGGK